MKTYHNGLALIRLFDGLRLQAYNTRDLQEVNRSIRAVGR